MAFGDVKKILALEAEVKNSHATLSVKTKEALSLMAELDKCKAELEKSKTKVLSLEADVKESAALKDKVKEVSQVNEDLEHQLKIKNEALQKAIVATKAAKARVVKV